MGQPRRRAHRQRPEPEVTNSLLPAHDPDPFLRQIGNTPLVELHNIGKNRAPSVRIFVKTEWRNPAGSVKDRPAYRMIRAAEVSGEMTPSKIILDATSGNTGIAYAMIAARRGYRVALCMPANASPERKKLLAAYGAELILTDPAESSDGAYYEAQKRYAERPDLYFYPDQYGNPQNPLAHFETTGPEIWQQTDGKITHFVAGVGTSGTLMGTGRFLRKKNPNVKLISVQPDSPFHGLEGLKHMETQHNPVIYDPKFPDQTIEIRTENAQEMSKRLTREEGLFAGVSGGANVLAALQLAENLDSGVVVAICPDGGDRYLSDKFWNLK
jgi:cysteine synthase B